MIDEREWERKRKRMQSNRESARRSRLRKQKQLKDLTSEVNRLQIINGQLVESIDGKEQALIHVESMNNLLRAQVMELTHRLRSFNSGLWVVDDVGGLAVEIPEISYPQLKPWQFNMPMQPMMESASADMFLV